ncbi:hypothetical protein [Nesterenkonia pannonica]|uniref:hypothetical protein n=1 Tax=Nesterenkonia pannonica TaxID=1548602 RepID=UPI00216466FD|nr:hypothetical protein [Nesterenkonia pannonica]
MTARTEPKLWAAPLPLTAAALCLGLLVLAATGMLTGLGEAYRIQDPGAATRWGLPIARYVHHIAMAAAVSAALLAAVAVPPRTGPRSRQQRRSRGPEGAGAPALLQNSADSDRRLDRLDGRGDRGARALLLLAGKHGRHRRG